MLLHWLTAQGEDVIQTSEKISGDWLENTPHPDFLISHGYRHILKQDVLAHFAKGRAINLHISYLPWNRGADPNLWSFIEDTPKGVTIHCIDAGIDTGDILLQKKVHLGKEHTLASSYARLQGAIVELFTENWPALKAGSISPKPQTDGGSLHRLSDKAPYVSLLAAKEWSTPVTEVMTSQEKIDSRNEES